MTSLSGVVTASEYDASHVDFLVRLLSSKLRIHKNKWHSTTNKEEIEAQLASLQLRSVAGGSAASS